MTLNDSAIYWLDLALVLELISSLGIRADNFPHIKSRVEDRRPGHRSQRGSLFPQKLGSLWRNMGSFLQKHGCF